MQLILRLEGPLAAYGSEQVDRFGPVRSFPGLSTLTGLIANALGIDRTEGKRLNDLQHRLRLAFRIDRDSAAGVFETDYQTAQLAQSDIAWTTTGVAADRKGSPATYSAPVILPKQYNVDTLIHAAFTLEDGSPGLPEVARALVSPFRPLFLGRKACLPTTYLYQGADTISKSPLQALLNLPGLPETAESVRLLWSRGNAQGVSELPASRTYRAGDLKDFASGPHKSARWVCEATISKSRLPKPPQEPEDGARPKP